MLIYAWNLLSHLARKFHFMWQKKVFLRWNFLAKKLPNKAQEEFQDPNLQDWWHWAIFTLRSWWPRKSQVCLLIYLWHVVLSKSIRLTTLISNAASVKSITNWFIALHFLSLPFTYLFLTTKVDQQSPLKALTSIEQNILFTNSYRFGRPAVRKSIIVWDDSPALSRTAFALVNRLPVSRTPRWLHRVCWRMRSGTGF